MSSWQSRKMTFTFLTQPSSDKEASITRANFRWPLMRFSSWHPPSKSLLVGVELSLFIVMIFCGGARGGLVVRVLDSERLRVIDGSDLAHHFPEHFIFIIESLPGLVQHGRQDTTDGVEWSFSIIPPCGVQWWGSGHIHTGRMIGICLQLHLSISSRLPWAPYGLLYGSCHGQMMSLWILVKLDWYGTQKCCCFDTCFDTA